MHVARLVLDQFRSYHHLDVSFAPGVTVLVGHNGQGKTNLLEAVAYLSTLGSHRVAGDAQLIRTGAQQATVGAAVVRADRTTIIEVDLVAGRANRARVNRSPVARPAEVLGTLRTVLFAPEDLAVVKGDPDGRRRYLDDLAVLVMPRMAGVLADYARVVSQRSALLKSAGAVRAKASALATLDVWDTRLTELASQIVAVRLQLASAVLPFLAEAYDQVSEGGRVALGYRSSADVDGQPDLLTRTGPGVTAEQLRPQLHADLVAAVERLRGKELDRGVCLVGPHRDDLLLSLNDLPTRGYASHGESWSYALALRLAAYRLLTAGPDWATGWGGDGEPVLLLDDVFAELDSRRRDRLADIVGTAGQVLITAAVPADVPSGLGGDLFEVAASEVSRG